MLVEFLGDGDFVILNRRMRGSAESIWTFRADAWANRDYEKVF